MQQHHGICKNYLNMNAVMQNIFLSMRQDCQDVAKLRMAAAYCLKSIAYALERIYFDPNICNSECAVVEGLLSKWCGHFFDLI